MSRAVIRAISGSVVHARMRGNFHIHESIEIGPRGLLGEVIHLTADELVAQIYEDTTGLRPGDPVRGTGDPLSVGLGPDLLGHIYDGLLRRLDDGDGAVEPGAAAQQPAADGFRFEPRVRVGETLTGGAVIGRLRGGAPCLLPPTSAGRVRSIAPEGRYAADDTVCELERGDGSLERIALRHRWPVRRPRPVAARLSKGVPMFTGQRIIDTLFPVARGGRAAIPGGFGTGKTILLESIAKWCDADVIVYVGCGERGNEMAEVLSEFPNLDDPRTGRRLLERTVIIANTSNMPVAAREASIYTGITVAEYFRDQGLHVALMADSTSRWAEALREVSGRLGELPGEAGYPAYLSSRLGEFYERAARVRTLAGDEGSVTLIGAVSPPAGDFTEPVTMHTKRYVRCFWGLDRDRAQARFYPAIHPLQSYSEDADSVARWWELQGYAQWREHRNRLLTLLEDQARLERMARIVGKDALPAAQQLTLLCAELVNDGLLKQSAFSTVDRYCSSERQAAFLRIMVRFIELAEKAVRKKAAQPTEIAKLQSVGRLQRLGEEFGEDDLDALDGLLHELETELESVTYDAR